VSVAATESPYDVAVLGAGAAGLVAAFRAAERGRRVVLLEKNRRPGVKILMSGGTRCNITNARGLRDLRCVSGPVDPIYDPREARGARSIQDAFGSRGAFLAPALRALNVEATVRLFEAEGVATKIEGNGKVFPVSDRAVDVLDALLARLHRSGAELRTNSPALDVRRNGEGFEVDTPQGTIRTRRVVVAVGGQSYPGSGTTGDGYSIARAFGHTLIEPRPALVPIRVAADWVGGLRGVTVPDVVAAVRDESGRVLMERREAVLFAHFGLTGPAILDVSRAVARSDRPEGLVLTLDLLPAERPEAVDAWLQDECRRGRPLVAGVVGRRLPRRLADALLGALAVPADRVGPELSREERRRLVGALKGLRLPVAGTRGFGKAEVTSGGVTLDEIDPATLESRIAPGLHFIGEVLDLDGRIGGYNFQAAWSLGWLAGEVV
jgi:predicted Rossmann fold flavoprotein